MKGLGGFPDGEIGIELEDIPSLASGAGADGERIGIEGAVPSEGVRISSITDWGPAHKSIMQVGDIIEKVSGYDVKGLSANFVQHLIKGPSGATPLVAC